MLCRRLVGLSAAFVIGAGLLPAMPAAAAPVPSAPQPNLAAARTTTMRVATFNVRTARARGDKRNWLQRVPDVAAAILSRRPGIVALQELGPGRADGVKGKIGNHIRQTSSLTNALTARGAGQYKLVRWTSYLAPHSVHGTQGARILYDSSRYRLVSNCPQTTGKSMWNPSCYFDLPVASGDSKSRRRAAGYARLADRSTGQQFWVVSAHLDDRKGSKANALKARQAAYVASFMAARNTANLPVIFGGDINSWLTDPSHYAPHRALVARGYADSLAAPTRIHAGYTTVNHFKTVLKKTNNVKLDVVMVKGARRFIRWENYAKIIDSARPSDHNMVLADIIL